MKREEKLEGWSLEWALKCGALRQMPAQGWHMESQTVVVRSWLGGKAQNPGVTPEGWCSLVSVAILSSFSSLSWEAELWTLACLDSNKKL